MTYSADRDARIKKIAYEPREDGLHAARRDYFLGGEKFKVEQIEKALIESGLEIFRLDEVLEIVRNLNK